MSNALQGIVLLVALSAIAAPAQAGMAVFGFSSIEQASGNQPAEQTTAITDVDVMDGNLVGGTVAYHFTFGPDSDVDQSAGAGSLIAHLDGPPHDSASAVNGAWTVLAPGPKNEGAAGSSYLSQGQGGGLFWTSGLSSGRGGGGLLGSGATTQGATNFSSHAHLTNSAVQLAGSNLALDHIPSGFVPIIIGKSLILEREISFSSSVTTPADLFAGGTGSEPQDMTPLPLARVDPLPFHAGGMAPEPGSLIVWALIGLIAGGTWWRHRRRLLALA